jgi:hypothetical protein
MHDHQGTIRRRVTGKHMLTPMRRKMSTGVCCNAINIDNKSAEPFQNKLVTNAHIL